MPITVVGSADLPELLPLVRAYCDFYQVTPSDQELLALSRALLADPQREGLQLLARDDADQAVGFATLVLELADPGRRPGGGAERPVRGAGGPRRRGGRGADCRLPGALPRAWRDPAGLADGQRQPPRPGRLCAGRGHPR
jgi:hypothetical protein